MPFDELKALEYPQFQFSLLKASTTRKKQCEAQILSPSFRIERWKNTKKNSIYLRIHPFLIINKSATTTIERWAGGEGKGCQKDEF